MLWRLLPGDKGFISQDWRQKLSENGIKARDLWHFIPKPKRKFIARNFYLKFRPES